MVVGGFSKTLAPDYRIGWLDGGASPSASRHEVPVHRRRAAAARRGGAYLEAGSYEHHLHMRRLYANRWDGCASWWPPFPAGTCATEPQGGFCCGWNARAWIRELFERARRTSCSCPARSIPRGARYRHCLCRAAGPGCALHQARWERLGAIARELAAAAR
jgi:DNA-binding transcriptional MocR family regulator